MKLTPIRNALEQSSTLHPKVTDGLGALDGGHRQFVDAAIRSRFLDSLEVDENLREGNEGANRWDYLIGDATLRLVVGLEPHGAKDSEISVLIAKRQAALTQLRPHFKPGQRVAAWFWVQSSGGGFKDTGIARRRANSAGIVFVGRVLMAKHLQPLVPTKRTKNR
jgi:hypothetical protein